VAQHSPGDLPRKWRSRAQYLRDFGGIPEAVKIWETAAAEHEEWFAEWFREFQGEAMTLVEAAKLSGYTADHLGALVRRGQIPNAGRKNAPLIRRADLPIKAAVPRAPNGESHRQPAKDVRAIADHLRGEMEDE